MPGRADPACKEGACYGSIILNVSKCQHCSVEVGEGHVFFQSSSPLGAAASLTYSRQTFSTACDHLDQGLFVTQALPWREGAWHGALALVRGATVSTSTVTASMHFQGVSCACCELPWSACKQEPHTAGTVEAFYFCLPLLLTIERLPPAGSSHDTWSLCRHGSQQGPAAAAGRGC
jgi:hypothetical protein